MYDRSVTDPVQDRTGIGAYHDNLCDALVLGWVAVFGRVYHRGV